MPFQLHWDGTGAKGLQAAPICIGVANTNRSTASAQFCVGYMPHTPDADKLSKPTELKHYLRQACAKAILQVLATVADCGVLCRLPNRSGVPTTRVLYPRLMAMNFDQPEAQLFFGLRNRTACTKCKRRKARSAFRKASSQKGASVRLLYEIVSSTSNTDEVRKTAENKLERWGFNPNRKCCLYTGLDKVFIRLPGTDEVTPCVDYRDRMHGILIFFFRQFKDIWDPMGLQPRFKRIMLQRLKAVCGSNAFRRTDGKAYRKQTALFSGVGTSAKDKVGLLFLLAHVLGHDAAILDPGFRVPLLTALAHVQLIIIASSGLRSYTEHELKLIFDTGYIVVFRAFQTIRTLGENSFTPKDRFSTTMRTCIELTNVLVFI